MAVAIRQIRLLWMCQDKRRSSFYWKEAIGSRYRTICRLRDFWRGIYNGLQKYMFRNNNANTFHVENWSFNHLKDFVLLWVVETVVGMRQDRLPHTAERSLSVILMKILAWVCFKVPNNNECAFLHGGVECVGSLLSVGWLTLGNVTDAVVSTAEQNWTMQSIDIVCQGSTQVTINQYSQRLSVRIATHKVTTAVWRSVYTTDLKKHKCVLRDGVNQP